MKITEENLKFLLNEISNVRDKIKRNILLKCILNLLFHPELKENKVIFSNVFRWYLKNDNSVFQADLKTKRIIKKFLSDTTYNSANQIIQLHNRFEILEEFLDQLENSTSFKQTYAIPNNIEVNHTLIEAAYLNIDLKIINDNLFHNIAVSFNDRAMAFPDNEEAINLLFQACFYMCKQKMLTADNYESYVIIVNNLANTLYNYGLNKFNHQPRLICFRAAYQLLQSIPLNVKIQEKLHNISQDIIRSQAVLLHNSSFDLLIDNPKKLSGFNQALKFYSKLEILTERDRNNIKNIMKSIVHYHYELGCSHLECYKSEVIRKNVDHKSAIYQIKLALYKILKFTYQSRDDRFREAVLYIFKFLKMLKHEFSYSNLKFDFFCIEEKKIQNQFYLIALDCIYAIKNKYSLDFNIARNFIILLFTNMHYLYTGYPTGDTRFSLLERYDHNYGYQIILGLVRRFYQICNNYLSLKVWNDDSLLYKFSEFVIDLVDGREMQHPDFITPHLGNCKKSLEKTQGLIDYFNNLIFILTEIKSKIKKNDHITPVILRIQAITEYLFAKIYFDDYTLKERAQNRAFYQLEARKKLQHAIDLLQPIITYNHGTDFNLKKHFTFYLEHIFIIRPYSPDYEISSSDEKKCQSTLFMKVTSAFFKNNAKILKKYERDKKDETFTREKCTKK